jgi:Anti-sigma factor NepR
MYGGCDTLRGPIEMKNLAALAETDSNVVELDLPVSVQIRQFLAGQTEGETLLHALYDHVLDEPVPERLTALLRR